MQRPPRAPEAPLVERSTWHQAFGQGGLLTLLALGLVCWPGLDLAVRRSLVFALLLWAGGALVWWNGERSSAVSRAGALIGVGLWGLIQLVPGLPGLLRLVPLPRTGVLAWIGPALALLLLGPTLTAGLGRLQARWGPAAGRDP
jgi:Ca2+-transporting ATPase